MLVVGAVAVAGFLIAVTLALAGAIIARHRADAIADLSALAAVGAAPGPQGCGRALQVAAANAGSVRRCQVLEDGSVVVEVALVVGAGRLRGLATGSARAGPGQPEPAPAEPG